jgi:hypothetical protein
MLYLHGSAWGQLLDRLRPQTQLNMTLHKSLARSFKVELTVLEEFHTTTQNTQRFLRENVNKVYIASAVLVYDEGNL